MASLLSKTKEQKILSDLKIAKNLWTRMKGLLGTTGLSADEGLWIHRCNSVHTFFMNYPIDCVFLDKKLKVVSTVENIKPGRLIWPQWGADSVVEMKAGQIKNLKIKSGEELHVGN